MEPIRHISGLEEVINAYDSFLIDAWGGIHAFELQPQNLKSVMRSASIYGARPTYFSQYFSL